MEPLTRQAPSSLCVGKRRPRIVVTGYGSFGSYAVNPSTVVVEALASSWSQRLSEEFDLITRVLAVDYEEALAMSRSSCEELQADFVIHVGVHSLARCVRIEKCAFSRGYHNVDVRGQVPLRNSCALALASKSGDGDYDNDEPPPLPIMLRTSLDCERLIRELLSAATVMNDNGESDGGYEFEDRLILQTSEDPGRYLCGYLFYCSLHLNRGRALFVHIPDFDTEVTPSLLTALLRHIVIGVWRQLDSAPAFSTLSIAITKENHKSALYYNNDVVKGERINATKESME